MALQVMFFWAISRATVCVAIHVEGFVCGFGWGVPVVFCMQFLLVCIVERRIGVLSVPGCKILQRN